METAKCRALITVLDCGSLAGAAELLGYTTSGISRMMASLEAEMGFPLLVRSKAGVSPTPDCTRMMPMFQQLATLGEACAQEALLVRGIEVGSLRVGSAYRAFYEPLANVLKEFAGDHPGVELNMMARNSTPLVQGIARGELDMAVISRREGEYEWTPLLEDPIVVLVPSSHPLAGSGSYPIERLTEDPFIDLYPDEESDNSRTLAWYGIRPNTRNAVLEVREARELVAVGMGVAMVNNIYANKHDERVRCLPLHPRVNIEIGVASALPELRSPAARAFMQFAMPHLLQDAQRIARITAL